MKKHMRPALIPALLAAAFPVYADTANTGESNESYASTLPTVKVVGQADTSVLKGYINYDEAAVTRNGQLSSKKRRKPSIRSTSRKTKTTARTI